MKFLIKNKFVSTFIGTICLYFGIGPAFILSFFYVYITSYIHLKQEKITMHYGLFIQLIFSFGAGISSPLAGLLENSVGFFFTTIIGFIIVFYTNMGFIFQQNIWLCYGLTFASGFGAGIATSLLFKNLTFYIPNKKGFLNGIFNIAMVFIGVIFGFGGEMLINYKGVTLKNEESYYPDEVAKRTYLYFFIAEFIIPVGLIFGLLFTYEYEQKNNIEKNSNSENNEKEEEKQKNELKKKYAMIKVKLALKSFRYWRFILFQFFISIATSFIAGTFRLFGALIGINGRALQIILLLQSLFSLILNPIIGILVDKKGPLIFIKIASIFSIPPAFILAFFMENNIIFLVDILIYICILLVLGLSFSRFIMNVYGIQESVILSGIIILLSKISEIITSITAFIFSLVCDKDKKCLKSKYKIMYIICGVCSVIGFLLVIFETEDKFIYTDIPADEEKLINKDEEKESLGIEINTQN